MNSYQRFIDDVCDESREWEIPTVPALNDPLWQERFEKGSDASRQNIAKAWFWCLNQEVAKRVKDHGAFDELVSQNSHALHVEYISCSAQYYSFIGKILPYNKLATASLPNNYFTGDFGALVREADSGYTGCAPLKLGDCLTNGAYGQDAGTRQAALQKVKDFLVGQPTHLTLVNRVHRLHVTFAAALFLETRNEAHLDHCVEAIDMAVGYNVRLTMLEDPLLIDWYGALAGVTMGPIKVGYEQRQTIGSVLPSSPPAILAKYIPRIYQRSIKQIKTGTVINKGNMLYTMVGARGTLPDVLRKLFPQHIQKIDLAEQLGLTGIEIAEWIAQHSESEKAIVPNTLLPRL